MQDLNQNFCCWVKLCFAPATKFLLLTKLIAKEKC